MADVQEGPDPNDAPITTPLGRRNAALMSIGEERNRQLAENGVDIEPEEPPAEPPAEEPPVEALPVEEPPEEPEQPPAEEPAEPAAAEPASEEPRTFTAFVDGKERQVTEAELVASYQMEHTARGRLEHATKIYNDTIAWQESVAETAAPPDEEDPDADVDEYLEAARKVQFGTQEETADVLKSLVETARAQDREGGQETSQGEIEARVFDKIEWTNALQKFGDKYADILEDQRIAKFAGNEALQNYQKAIKDSQDQGTPRPAYWDILAATGNEVREMFGTSAPIDEDPPNPPSNPSPRVKVQVSQDRTEGKRTSIQPPPPRSGPPEITPQKAAQTAQQSEVQKRRQGISEIAKARGQAVT